MMPLRKLLLAACLGSLALSGCKPAAAKKETAAPSPGERPLAPAPFSTGRQAAQVYCQTCHLVPKPEMLDKRTWREEALPKMACFNGLTAPTREAFEDLDILLAAGFFPKAPLIPAKAWDAIVDYYVASAPEKLISPQDQSKIQIGLKQFTVHPARFGRKPALTSMVRIDPARHLIEMGDATSQAVDFLDATGELVSTVRLGNIPVRVTETDRGFYFAAIGHFFPREEPHGQLLLLEKTLEGLRRKVILSDLPRTTDVQFADFNGDGRMDFALCVFGNFIGRFSWFENLGDDQYTEHVLFDKPGALNSVVYDFNQDGHPDLAVLVAQATESMFIFINDGKGNFTKHLIFQKQPSWGHSWFELVDFDGDGRMDLLVTNGDNADFTTSPTKPYHGIRLYLNKGNLQFEEAWFFHLNGAYKAVARDFDHDGDLDIAAVSFFPDYENSPRESFVYLENQGGMNFTASTFAECISGRWLTMDAGDLEGDGADDIVLGSLTKMPTIVPDALKNSWLEKGPSVMILKNNLHKAGGSHAAR